MSLDRAHGLLLLLPAAVVVGPLALWAGGTDPLPLATAAGAALLSAVAAALVLFLRRAEGRLVDGPLLLALVAGAALALWQGAPTDTFERDGALCALAVFLASVLGGASLGPGGRASLGLGAAAISLLALAPALLSPGDGANFGGALGNSGSLAQVALPGAAAGLGWVLVSRARSIQWAALAFLAALLHATQAPVLTTLLSLALALVAFVSAAIAKAGPAAESSPGERERSPRARRALGSLALIAVLGVGFLRLAPDRGAEGEHNRAAPAVPGEPTAVPTGEAWDREALGGGPVRMALWRGALEQWSASSLWGAGAGQFQATHPPFRDPTERRLSNRGGALVTEVEHPHNDYLRGFLEHGVLGGAALLGLCTLVAVAALRRLLAAESPADAALALGALAMLANAALHSPLLGNAASAALAGAFFGAVLGRPLGAVRARRSPLALLALLGLLALAPAAHSLLLHGKALADRGRAIDRGDRELGESTDPAAGPAARALARSKAEVSIARAEAHLQDAHRARPDSPAVLGLLARGALASGDREGAARWNGALLARRPQQTEALVRDGLLHALAGRTEAARSAWAAVLAMDPEQTAAHWNLVRLELELGSVEAARTRAKHFGPPAERAERLLDLVADAQLGGFAGPADLLGMLTDGGVLASDQGAAEALFHRSQADRSADPERQSGTRRRTFGLESLAHALWAEQHLAAGDRESARRSLRQAYRASRELEQPGSPLLAIHLAALEWELGARERAVELLHQCPPTPRATAAARPGAVETLRAAELLR